MNAFCWHFLLLVYGVVVPIIGFYRYLHCLLLIVLVHFYGTCLSAWLYLSPMNGELKYFGVFVDVGCLFLPWVELSYHLCLTAQHC